MQPTKSPMETDLKQQMDAKLNRHFLACSAFVGTAVLMAPQNADASIVYSGLQNLPVPTTNSTGGIYIDMTLSSHFIPSDSGQGPNEGLNTLLPGWDLNFYRGENGTLNWYYPLSGSTPQTLAVNSGGQTTALSAGVTIDGSLNLDSYGAMEGQFTSTTAYMGVQFHDANNNIRYGWVQVAGGPSSGFPATIIDWAYEDSGAGITAGAVPEPSTVALGFLSAGALGVAAWRKRKKS